MKRMTRVGIVLILIFMVILLSFIGCEPKDKGENELVFTGPVEIGVKEGSALPGTHIRVVSITDDTAKILIEGQTARKKVGDSLDWKGSVIENVDLDLKLRILWMAEGTVQTVGTARLSVRDVNPEMTSIQSESNIRYVLPVTYSVKQGDRIPGTLIEYVGKDSEKGAEFAGLTGYPFRKGADSLMWEGKLRDDVWLKLDLRVARITDASVQLAGVATIWVDAAKG